MCVCVCLYVYDYNVCRALELLAAADATESTVQDMRQQVSMLLDAHDRLAGGARTKMGTVAAAKRKLRQVHYVFECVCVYVCVWVCVCVHVHSCVSVCVCMYQCICT